MKKEIGGLFKINRKSEKRFVLNHKKLQQCKFGSSSVDKTKKVSESNNSETIKSKLKLGQLPKQTHLLEQQFIKNKNLKNLICKSSVKGKESNKKNKTIQLYKSDISESKESFHFFKNYQNSTQLNKKYHLTTNLSKFSKIEGLGKKMLGSRVSLTRTISEQCTRTRKTTSKSIPN
jgi:hypothetical protein